jgi:hypothetical protein
LDWVKMQIMTIKDKISIVICEWRETWPKTLSPIFYYNKKQWIFKIKRVLKHDHLHNSHSQSQNNILEYKYSKQ